MNKILKYLAGLTTAALIVFSGAAAYYVLGTTKPASDSSEPVRFEINIGEKVSDVSKKLKQAGLIKSEQLFEIYVWLNGLGSKLQAGDYLLSRGSSIKEIATNFLSGKKAEIKVLIREGETLEEIARRLEELKIVSAAEFLDMAGRPRLDYRENTGYPAPADFSRKYPFLSGKPAYRSLEGYLFPDTYRFNASTSPKQVIDKLLDNFDAKVAAGLRETIARSGKNLYEVLIMASILEREVREPADMKKVADIFWRRLERGQPLQSDATLSYLLGDKKAAHSSADLAIDSPFNSYKYAGLPPTPIGNPGLIAIEAAVYPEANDYNFFLSSSADGQTIFSRTFEEHVRNKAKYLK